MTFVGCTMSLDLAWDLSDTFNGLMMIPNLIGVLALSGTVMKITKNYVDRTFRNKDIKIISDKRYTQSYIVKENVHKDVVFFIAKLENNNEKRQVKEIEEILWIDINEVENILTYDSLKELWKEAKKDFLVL